MAEPTAPAAEAASVPEPALVQAAERFTRERFVHEGEDAATALAPGSARRRALDAALAELDRGAKVPSTQWRRRYALLLGLERVLSEDEPRLADDTLLNPHQVDALSGTLVALLASAQKGADGLRPDAAAPVLAIEEEPRPVVQAPPREPEDPEDEDDEDDDHEEPVADLDDDDEDEPDEAEEPEEAPEPAAEEESYDDAEPELDEDVAEGGVDDPNAHKRFWFEHATGAGKTVAAMGFVEASRTGGVLILTHRRNLVDQFLGELRTRGYAKRESPPLLDGEGTDKLPRAGGPVTVETYQWFVRNAGRISDAYTIVICDEAHTALGEKTSAAIRAWTGPIFVGMTATGALIARHVTDLFPTQTSRFDLAQAARRGVIAPLRCIRIPPGPGVRTIAKVPLRKGDVDVEFDQELLAELLDQLPFNLAIADLYKTRFNGVPGVVYAAGVRHAMNVAEAFREVGIRAMGVSGETPKRELAEILAQYERGEIDVLVNAQLLAEGWNSPRATICMHLAPTASKRIYQQRVGRVTRRHPGKESGIVVDFVHPATRHDDPVVTLHSLLDRDVYRGGAIVVGPVRRGRGRRLRVERRVIPVTADMDRRIEVFERELWRIAVEHLDYGEQVQWAALAGARVAPSGWRRARAMLHFDRNGELKRNFLLTAVERNKNSQLRVRALQEIAQSRDADAFERAVDIVRTWTRDERREGVKVLLQALAERRIGRRDQASHWIWDLADMTREVHEEYAVQRWPETKRLLGLLVNSSGGAHARNARRLVHGARKQDRRLAAALLAAAVAHTPEAMEVVRGARTRMARKPSALSRELLKNFPKRKSRSRRRKRSKDAVEPAVAVEETLVAVGAASPDGIDDASPAEGAPAVDDAVPADAPQSEVEEVPAPRRRRSSRRRKEPAVSAAEPVEAQTTLDLPAPEEAPASDEQPKRPRSRRMPVAAEPVLEAPTVAAEAVVTDEAPVEKPKRTRTRKKPEVAPAAPEPVATDEAPVEAKPKRTRARKQPVAAEAVVTDEAPAEKPKRTRTRKAAAATDNGAVAPEPQADEAPAEKPKRAPRTRKKAADAEPAQQALALDGDAAVEKPAPRTRRKPVRAATADGDGEVVTPAPRTRRKPTRAAADVTPDAVDEVVKAAAAVAQAAGDAAPKRRRTTTARAKTTAKKPGTADDAGSDGDAPERDAA